MRVAIDDGDHVVVAAVSGEVDVASSPDLRSKLIDAVENYSQGLVVDLSETSYLDSSGVQVLFDIALRLAGRQQEMHIVIEPESFLSDVATAVNLAAVARIHSGLQPAVAACRAS